MIKIKDIITILQEKENKQIVCCKNITDGLVRGLAINSKLVKSKYAFFSLQGNRLSGDQFIPQACRNGATVIITEKDISFVPPVNVTLIRVKDVIKSLALISNHFYSSPSRKINMTSVTGTNGKTTITYAVEHILRNCKIDIGVMGTINYRFKNYKIIPINTTGDILTIQQFLNKMIKNGVKICIMEVSSHALAQRRIEGILFDQAIFTNLTQDHLDYHLTKENYFRAKLKLFTDYLKNSGKAIINVDDHYGRRLKKLIKNRIIITYGIYQKADVTAKAIQTDTKGSSFILKYFDKEIRVKTNLVGIYNIYNLLASIIVSATIKKINLEELVSGLENIYVPGRLEMIKSKANIHIFVDYAHTEDALRNVLNCLNSLKSASTKLITVFGCGGDRDKTKRPKMGKVACELSDRVIITSDNPRSEDPDEIIYDIRKGITKKNNFVIIPDRYEAIREAIDIAEENDIILVAGKGHESYQIIKDKKIPFDDREVVKSILSNKNVSLEKY